MTEELNLKAIQRKAYTSYHQDGLIDIMIGIGLIWFIAMMLVELVWLGGIIVPVLLPVYIAAKQKLTVPRIGYVKFGTKGKGLMYMISGIVVLFGVLGLFFAVMFADPIVRDWIEIVLIGYYNLFIAGIAGGLTLLIALSTGIRRFYIYAILIIGTFIIAQVFWVDILISASIIPITFIVLGVITLIRFLRENPLPKDGVGD